jgi:uncharacterized protein YjbI with pentapeptide repeats
MAKRKKNRSQGGNDYSSQSFVGADFSNTDLDGADFSSCSLTGVDFSNADLNQSNFQSASITGCDFSNTNLCEADFQSASLTGCDFSNSDIDGATFDGVSMTGCDFSNVDIEQATGLEFLTEITDDIDQSFSFVAQNSNGGTVIFGDQAGGNQANVYAGGSMNIRSVNGTSITDLGWVRITSEGGSTGVSSFGGLRSNNGQYVDTRVADIRIGNGILRMEVIGAGRIRCSIRDVNSHATGEISELILEAGHNVDINGDFNMNIENRYTK